MKTGEIKIIDVSDKKNPGMIKKQAVNSTTKEVLGTLDAEFYENGKATYYGEKFSPFYASDYYGNRSYVKSHLHAMDLYVKKSARKKGIGTKLMQSLVKESKDRGCEGRIVLLAGCKEASPLPFYRKIGFATNNKQKNLRLDEILKFRMELDKNIQEFMFLTKAGIKKLLKMV